MGTRARAREDDIDVDVLPPAASDFWDEGASAVHHAIRGPDAPTPAEPTPAEPAPAEPAPAVPAPAAPEPAESERSRPREPPTRRRLRLRLSAPSKLCVRRPVLPRMAGRLRLPGPPSIGMPFRWPALGSGLVVIAVAVVAVIGSSERPSPRRAQTSAANPRTTTSDARLHRTVEPGAATLERPSTRNVAVRRTVRRHRASHERHEQTRRRGTHRRTPRPATTRPATTTQTVTVPAPAPSPAASTGGAPASVPATPVTSPGTTAASSGSSGSSSATPVQRSADTGGSSGGSSPAPPGPTGIGSASGCSPKCS